MEYISLTVFIGIFVAGSIAHARLARLPGRRRTQRWRSWTLAGAALVFVATLLLALLGLTLIMMWILLAGTPVLIGIWVTSRVIDSIDLREARRRDLALGYPAEPRSISLVGTWLTTAVAGATVAACGMVLLLLGVAVAGGKAPSSFITHSMVLSAVAILVLSTGYAGWRWWREQVENEEWLMLVRGISAREEARYEEGLRAGRGGASRASSE